MHDEIKNKIVYLFDMDGTLVDTEPIGPKVFEALFTDFGANISVDEKELFIKVWRREGTELKEDAFIENLRQKYVIDVEPDKFLHIFFNNYKQAIITADALAGADEFIKKSRTAGVKLAIVTSSKRDQAISILSFHGWAELIDVIVAEEDITNFKPDPEPYLLAAKKLSASPEQCVVFEDAKNGIIAGKAAGMFVVGLRAGNEVEQDLSAADLVVPSFNELL